MRTTTEQCEIVWVTARCVPVPGEKSLPIKGDDDSEASCRYSTYNHGAMLTAR